MEDDRKLAAENKQQWEKHHEERAALLQTLAVGVVDTLSLYPPYISSAIFRRF
jgi:hypothetical protein